MKIRYIGVGAYNEQSVTGNFALWQPDQVSDVSTSDAAKLVATGRFIYDDESTWEGQRLAGIPRAIIHTGLPMILPPSSNVGNNGALTLGSFPAGSLSFAATSGTGVVVTGTGTSFASTDVGRVIVVDGGKLATITAYTSATSVTVTISGGTLSTTAFANNAWQLATPMPVTLPSCYMYFPANAIYAGSAAGMYYVSMSSTVAGTIYNNIYTGGDAVIPATPTPFVTTGPGVFTQTTGADITVLGGITVPGGSLGKNGVLRAVTYWSGPSNANTKNYYVYFGGINIFGQSTTTSSFLVVRNELINQGSESANISNNWLSSGGTATYPYFNRTINAAVDQALSFTCRIANANDYAMLNAVLAETIYGA